MSASPQRKPQPTQSQRGGSSGIGLLSSPKFSFRAALVQHKASKLSSSPSLANTNDAGSVSQDSKLVRPISSVRSGIPSVSARTRLNSTASEVRSTSTLPRRRNASPDATSRASSSLGKRAIDSSIGDSSGATDFGPAMRAARKSVASQGGGVQGKKVSPTSMRKASKLPGPPTARTQWTAGPSMPAPSPTVKVPRKVFRTEAVAEVHANITISPSNGASPETRIASLPSRTRLAAIPATAQRPKIGTLPKPKARPVPVKTLMDESPFRAPKAKEDYTGLLSGLRDGESESDSGDDEEEGEEDGLEGPDVSRIITKRLADPNQKGEEGDETTGQKSKAVGSRIPSIGTRTAPRLSRASTSSNNAAEKENLSEAGSGLKKSVGPASGRGRTSLPLAQVTQPITHQASAAQQPAEDGGSTASTSFPPASPSMSSLAALRSRGLQSSGATSTDSNLPSRTTSNRNLGIKTSIINANPVHPSIRALQPHYLPISTPEALIKAKERLSGALLSSSSSTSSSLSSIVAGMAVSPSERGSSLGRSTGNAKLVQGKARIGLKNVSEPSAMPPRSPIKSSLLLLHPEPTPMEKEGQSLSSTKTNAEISASEIDANLLASLKVVAQKANLNVRDLLEEKERGRREASAELEVLAEGDVSVDLMALDLAASPAASDGSMLRSPPVAHTVTPQLDAKGGREEEEPQVEEQEDSDRSCASPSVLAAARIRTPARNAYRVPPSIPSTPFPSTSSSSRCPPSATMSARTRSRLKKALRESLNIEAHFNAMQLNHLATAGGVKDTEEVGGLRKSISAMLLTEDDALDELVSAVARIELGDVAQATSSPATTDDVPTLPAESETDTFQYSISEDTTALIASLQAELSSLSTQLSLSQTRETTLQTQLSQEQHAAARTSKTQTILQADLSALKAELAGVEWGRAKTAWNKVRVEALQELEDCKVAQDTMLVLGAQIGVWERMVRASVAAVV